jgi:hypothetical protein
LAGQDCKDRTASAGMAVQDSQIMATRKEGQPGQERQIALDLDPGQIWKIYFFFYIPRKLYKNTVFNKSK